MVEMENVGAEFGEDAFEIAAPNFLAGNNFIDAVHAVHIGEKFDQPTRVP